MNEIVERDRIEPDLMAAAFGRAFWAFIFVIDFKVTIDGVGVDLLPDFAGWAIFSTVLRDLGQLAPAAFTRLRKLGHLLLGLSLLTLVEISHPQTGATLLPDHLVSAVNMSLLVLQAFFFWRFLGLLVELARAVPDPDLEGKTRFRRALNLGLDLFGLSLFLPVLLSAGFVLIAPLAIGMLILSLVNFFLLMGLMRRFEIAVRDLDASGAEIPESRT